MGELADDYQELTEFLMTIATKMISKSGRLAPCGAAIKADGACVAIGALPESPLDENPEEIERLLIEGLRQGVKSGEYRATAIALDMLKIQREGHPAMPAIKLILESRSGSPANYYQPYRRRWFRKASFESPFIMVGRPVVFDDKLDIS